MGSLRSFTSDATSASFESLDTVGCKSFPDFVGTAGEIPVNSYNRPYDAEPDPTPGGVAGDTDL
jgi:hypothetical protein